MCRYFLMVILSIAIISVPVLFGLAVAGKIDIMPILRLIFRKDANVTENT
ncbi:hypothetical protein PENSPDRAFT_755554 [Peniophora sp. CONT]|nr:hypothetical protein PENSPDRAFT_755554 [Peniophora sp. CONT]